MNAIYAGLTAWAIELGIALTILMVLRSEEQKVYRRRQKKKLEDEELRSDIQ
jgi:hypothetical protein